MIQRCDALLRGLFGVAVLVVLPLGAVALTAPSGLDDLGETDAEALETLAGHDASLRESALLASLHIDELVEIQRIQAHSSAAFQERVGKLDRERQEQVWELVREPGLLEELGSGAPKSRAEIEAIAARQEGALGETILELGVDEPALLRELSSIHDTASDRFDELLADLPEDHAGAFGDLLERPDLLTLLATRVRMTVQLGESFGADPDGTRAYLAALSEEVAERNRRAEEEWAQRLESDPEAAAELESSARRYADEYGYDYDDLTRESVHTSVNIYLNPYPYWFGYPLWYHHHAYYPYGYWYPYRPHLGYYHYRGHRRVYFGLPSPFFFGWFFGGHDHHYRHLSHHFRRHHDHYSHARSVSHRAVRHHVRHRDGRSDRVGFRSVSRDDSERSARRAVSRRETRHDDGVRPRDSRHRDRARFFQRGDDAGRDRDYWRRGDDTVRDRDRLRRGDDERRRDADAKPRRRDVEAKPRRRDADAKPGRRDTDAKPTERRARPRNDGPSERVQRRIAVEKEKARTKHRTRPDTKPSVKPPKERPARVDRQRGDSDRGKALRQRGDSDRGKSFRQRGDSKPRARAARRSNGGARNRSNRGGGNRGGANRGGGKGRR